MTIYQFFYYLHLLSQFRINNLRKKHSQTKELRDQRKVTKVKIRKWTGQTRQARNKMIRTNTSCSLHVLASYKIIIAGKKQGSQ